MLVKHVTEKSVDRGRHDQIFVSRWFFVLVQQVKISSKHLDMFSFQIAIFSMLVSSWTHHVATSCSSSHASASQETKREGRQVSDIRHFSSREHKAFPHSSVQQTSAWISLTNWVAFSAQPCLLTREAGQWGTGLSCLPQTHSYQNKYPLLFLPLKIKPSSFIILFYPERQ